MNNNMTKKISPATQPCNRKQGFHLGERLEGIAPSLKHASLSLEDNSFLGVFQQLQYPTNHVIALLLENLATLLESC